MSQDDLGESDLQERCINTIRGFAMDAPQRANSGHPGTAMALAPLAYTLWTRIMRYDAADPLWPNRDRFVLSAGHASILLYSMLHLTGYGLTKDDLEDFRQWNSLTPGHPEVGHTDGVEVTTGPLGQGIANAVGMAIAEHHLRARFGEQLFNHHTFVVAGDGCLMEGISHEAGSLAGHLGLDKLVLIYDDNHITIDGPTELAVNDDAAERFQAYGWHVEKVGEIANDVDALEAAVRRAMAVEGKPAMIVLRSHIGYPSPKVTDSNKAHGDPLGPDEIAITKGILGIPPDEDFWCPDDVLATYRAAGARGRAAREEWDRLYAEWPRQKDEIAACLAGGGVPGWQEALPTWTPGDPPIATRNASKQCLDAILDKVPGLIGGGADLTANTGTLMPGEAPFSPLEPAARQLHFGVREHAMGAVMNGMAHHGGVLPIGGTFFVFSDYMRGAIRLSALSRSKLIYSFTHDSVGVGEDGPTHQPIEHLASLRAMPQLRVIRPADANEVATAWKIAIESDGPTCLILSRQNLPILDGTAGNEGVRAGAYVLREADGATPQLVIVATGSEVWVALGAATLLQADGVPTRVVSMPSWDLFEAQDESYRDEVLPPSLPTLSVEAASTFGWSRWADGSVGIDRFGASAPGSTVLAELGIDVPNVVGRAQQLLARRPTGWDSGGRT